MERQSEIAIKIERLVRLMTDEKLGGVLLNAQHNFAWLTAGGMNGIDLSREAGSGSLFVRRDGKRFVLANRIEIQRLCSEELDGLGFEPVEYAWEEDRADATIVSKKARSLVEANQRVASDLALGADSIIESKLVRLRGRLTTSELERYVALGRDAGDVIGKLARVVRPGMTEREIARYARDSLASRGIHAVVTLIAADERLAKYRHPIPTEKKWEKIVMIVVSGRRAGLFASLSRIVHIGRIPDELLRRTEACARVNAQLLWATKPGVSGGELYSTAARSYEAEGFPGEEHLHHQGGATGYRGREWVAYPKCRETVQSPQAFAWNPSITGTKVEETCLIFDDRVQVITASPEWPGISLELGESTLVLPNILSI
jgi:Xaa-Pro aminopeptidase